MHAKTLSLILALAGAFALTTSAEAQRKGGATSSQPKLYKWTDKDGNVHYSDQIPPEAVEYAREKLNTEGISVDRVDRAMTAEEIAVRDAEEKRLADAAKLAEERRKADEALINSYASEEDLTRAFNQRIDLLEQTVEARRIEIGAREKSLAQLVASAADMERAGKPVTETLKSMISTEREEIARQKQFLATRESEKDKARADYERDLGRYREAMARSKTDESGS